MLGEALIQSGAITRAQLDQALAAQRTSGALLGQILLELNFVTEESLSRALASEAGVPFVIVNGLRPDPAAVALIPERFARQHLLAPVGLNGSAIEVLQANPFDVLAMDDLQRLVMRPVTASWELYVSEDKPALDALRALEDAFVVSNNGPYLTWAAGRSIRQIPPNLDFETVLSDAARHLPPGRRLYLVIVGPPEEPRRGNPPPGFGSMREFKTMSIFAAEESSFRAGPS